MGKVLIKDIRGQNDFSSSKELELDFAKNGRSLRSGDTIRTVEEYLAYEHFIPIDLDPGLVEFIKEIDGRIGQRYKDVCLNKAMTWMYPKEVVSAINDLKVDTSKTKMCTRESIFFWYRMKE